ncbi:hypothetical protein [Flavisolibacter nicotianae]|uniref:hypothetical protein n=1 Tax=Flavisolibacter nicotianae TaxID=2364882 RepID=UPI0013C489EE|nr:hypothetical protein [Flavisolibacter nicotianae]
MKESNIVEIEVTNPTEPSRMSKAAIRRLAGLFTTDSDSSVVKPVPEQAESDWKCATSIEKPVISNAMEPIRTTNMERAKMRRKETKRQKS